MDFVFQFIKKFEQFSQKKELISKNDQIVVAVSGGLDSVTLLFCLQKLKKQLRLELLIAHLNHCLREEESDLDEKFVKELAENYGEKFISEKIDVKSYAKKQSLSIETAAREVRYQFFEKVCEQFQFTKIATGHQANDQAETVLQSLIRGSGWRGVGGIPVKRGEIIRPLLFAYREDLEKMAGLANLNFRTDQSNYSLDFQRNKIRHKIIPVIKKDFNPQISRKLNEFSQIFKEGDKYLNEQAKIALNSCLKLKYEDKIILEIERFCSYFTILRKYVLFHLLMSVGLSKKVLSFALLSQILQVIDERKMGHFVPVAEGWQIGVDHSGIVFFSEKRFKSINQKLKIGEAIQIAELGLNIQSEIISLNSITFNQDGQTEYIDFGKLNGLECEIRSIHAGDSFCPLGLDYRQKFSDFFIDHKIPLIDRQNALTLTNNGKTVWLIGYRLDHRFRITNNTKQVVRFKIIND